jgi:DNA-binding transcriptional MerR regulator
MKLKQAAFDFDFTPDENVSKDGKTIPVQPNIEINHTPVEVDITTSIVSEPPVAIKKSTRGRMKLSEMSADVDKIEIPDDAVLFSRSYYSIGAVAEMFKVNQSLIRYWENEFSILKPKKNGKGDRLFRPEDIKNLKLIHHLLRERKYTIEGAKDFLKKSKYADKKFEMIESLKSLKSFLHELKAGL